MWTPVCGVNGYLCANSASKIRRFFGSILVALALAAASNAASVSLSAPPSSIVGGAVQMTAVVSGADAGTVAFYSDTTYLGVVRLSNGTAEFSVRLLPTGHHNLSAIYTGNDG